MTELLTLKRDVKDVLDEIMMIKENVPRIFSYLQKGYQVNFNSKIELIIALLIKISTVLL